MGGIRYEMLKLWNRNIIKVLSQLWFCYVITISIYE